MVENFFKSVTGRPLLLHEEWSAWLLPDITHVRIFESYIRPCHRAILDAFCEDLYKPASFLRQLLRPYGFKIEASKTGWRLSAPVMRCVSVREGKTVDWMSSHSSK